MEHSYSRDCRPIEGANGLTTRTLMVHRPPQCPSCHVHPTDEGMELDEANHPPIPSYNEATAKESMNECSRVANNVRNVNSDDDDWEEHVNKSSWSSIQERLFSRVARILDLDHLARLATIGKQHEPVQRRVIIDKSVQRMRQALASVSWDSRLTQWIHGLLMDNLPPTYMASYLDILQTLKTKLPTLMDKMLFGKPMNINQDLLTPVMKKQWDPVVSQKTRKLPVNAVIVVIPCTPISQQTVPPRMQKWYQLLSTMGLVTQISVPGNSLNKQPIDQFTEHLVSITRVKIQDLRAEQPTRQIILVGFNAGASLALQVALQETVNCVVCMGFAYNTINGIRGTPDDHILNVTTPVMFVIGQNSARTSQEEMEALREKMQSESSLVVVGSADDVLRVPKNKRQIEGITQSMVDNMITDEVYEFIKSCLINPPGPRQPTINIGHSISHTTLPQSRRIGGSGISTLGQRKRKLSQGEDSDLMGSKTKIAATGRSGNLIGRPRIRPLPSAPTGKQQLLSQPSTEVLNMAIQSILPDSEKSTGHKQDDGEEGQILSTYEIITQPQRSNQGVGQTISSSGSMVLPVIQRSSNSGQSTQKIKMIPSNQFVQLKPPAANTQKIYTIKTSPMLTTTSQGTGGENLRGQSQVFTVKTTGASQFLSSGSASQQLVLSPQKFTVLKSSGLSNAALISTGGESNIKTTDLSSNIFDMPILFADNEGNIHDTAPIVTSSTSGTSSTQASQIIISQSATGEQGVNRSFVVNNTMPKAKPNKVVFINRNTMKPCPNIISKNVPPLKYAKVVVTNPKTSTPSLVTRAPGPTDPEKPMATITIQKPKTMEIPAGTLVKNTSAFTGTSGVINTAISTSAGNKQYQPIIINVDSDRTTIKNMIKVGGDSQIKPTILLKPGGLKQIPVLKPGILNRNLTVRKVVNLVQTKSGVAAMTPVPLSSSPSESPGSTAVSSSGTHFITPPSSNVESDKN